MGRDVTGILRHWDATGEEIRRAIELGVRDAIREHAAAGHTIVVWDEATQQGIEIPAASVVLPEGDDFPEDRAEVESVAVEAL